MPMKKGDSLNFPAADAAVLETMRGMLGNHPAVTQKQMFGLPGFFTEGKSFSSVFGDSITLKLPPEQVETLIQESHISQFEPMGRKMTGWILLHRDAPEDYAQDEALILSALDYVAEIAKAQPKKKKAGRKKA